MYCMFRWCGVVCHARWRSAQIAEIVGASGALRNVPCGRAGADCRYCGGRATPHELEQRRLFTRINTNTNTRLLVLRASATKQF
jgi:hypothetical protein